MDSFKTHNKLGGFTSIFQCFIHTMNIALHGNALGLIVQSIKRNKTGWLTVEAKCYSFHIICTKL